MMDSGNQSYFDFTTKDELPEEHSPQKRSCPHCSKPIPIDSLFCLFCGEPVSSAKKHRNLVWVVFIILITLLFLILALR